VITHLLFLFRQASQGRSLRLRGAELPFVGFIALGFGVRWFVWRSPAAAMGIGAMLIGKLLATAADAILRRGYGQW
jgi:hypothetical protein